VVLEPSEPLLWEYSNKSPADLRRGLSCSNIWLSYKSNPVASWIHLHDCRCFQEHQGMLWQSLRALCLPPGGPGSIWNYVGAPVRSTRESRRFACDFRTDLHFADVQVHTITASKCISKLARSRPCSVSLSSLDRECQAHLELLSSTACSKSRYTVCRWVVI